MEPCNQTANGFVIGEFDAEGNLELFPEVVGRVAAAPLPLINRTVNFPDGTAVKIQDTFGNPNYQFPFYHYQYGRFVMPLDILTDQPLHYLHCELELK